MADSVAGIAKLPIGLPAKLWILRLASRRRGPRHKDLAAWGAAHPEIAVGEDWLSKAWWGAAAGEIVRWHLSSSRHRDAALKLVAEVEDSALEEARKNGQGVIVATAHLGPPQFLLNWMVEQRFPLLAWTATQKRPAGADHATYLDPRQQDRRSFLLVKSTLHLRRGGILLGAADLKTGERTVCLERLGMQRHFSAGLPALARETTAPVVLGLALWKGNRVHIRFQPLEMPDSRIPGEEQDKAWLERYWDHMLSAIRHTPENLRFLRWAVERVEPFAP